MTGTTSPTEAWIDVDTVVDEQGRAAFDLIAASVVELAGFQVAALSVVHEGRLVTVAVEGAAAARATLLGSAAPLEPVLAELENGVDWGRFRYLPQEVQDGALSDWTWTSFAEDHAAPGTWNATDICVAVLRSEAGEVVGLLSIDLPLTGRHPLPSHRLLLDRYAAQAERTVNMALDRAAMAQRVRLAETARRVVRLVTHQRDLDRIIDESQNAVQVGFESDFVALRLYATDTHPGFGNRTLTADRETRRLVHRVAERALGEQLTVEVGVHTRDPLLTEEEHRELGAFIASRDLETVLLVPVGSVDRLLGILVVARADALPAWTTVEREALLEIARDIGQAIAAETARRHEAALTDELRRLAAYKSELLSTVSHELKNPLGAIAGHVELLGLATDLSDDAKFSVSSLARATDRMRRVVDDLLLLARLDDSSMPVEPVPVELAPVIEGALELVQLAAERRRLEVGVDVPEQPVRVMARPPDVDRVLTNLLSNAVKYTPRNGHITVTVSGPSHGEVALAVTDDGIGISEEDLDGLFNEFFRSTNPRARAQPGSGLGLAICHRIATRYGGRIEVESTLGEGSTFRLVLPAAPS